MTDSSRAVFLSQEIALVLCNNHQSPASITYTCYSTSNDSAVGPTFTIYNLDSPSTFASYRIIVPVVVTVAVIVALLLVILVVYLRRSRVKAKPPQMCPIGSVTASLLASTLAPFGLEPVESISFEFPRENLRFVKVLGKLKLHVYASVIITL